MIRLSWALIGLAAGSALMLLSGCAGAMSQSDAMAYLVQAGQLSSDVALYRKHDWPADGYQISDSVLRADGKVLQTFDFAPWGSAEFGSDGGQMLEIGADGTVRVLETRDGGKPYDQFFVGRKCWNWSTLSPGTGWLVWKADVGPAPRAAIATLGDSADPNACPPLNRALTRYWSGIGMFPFRAGGANVDRMVQVIASEHYDHASITASVNMERMYFGRGWGLIAWEAWSKTRADGYRITERCPPIPWRDTPAADGYRLVDCRIWTNIVTQPEGSVWVVDQFGWPQ
ncbi:MAG: hypothetical protein V4491_00045 [Pseudomonadota bacterium]